MPQAKDNASPEIVSEKIGGRISTKYEEHPAESVSKLRDRQIRHRSAGLSETTRSKRQTYQPGSI